MKLNISQRRIPIISRQVFLPIAPFVIVRGPGYPLFFSPTEHFRLPPVIVTVQAFGIPVRIVILRSRHTLHSNALIATRIKNPGWISNIQISKGTFTKALLAIDVIHKGPGSKTENDEKENNSL
jgi:hypothetical protein